MCRWAPTCFRQWTSADSSSITSCRLDLLLAATNKVIEHVEQTHRSIPEVDEHVPPNRPSVGPGGGYGGDTGDISVRLKSNRSRSTDDVISQVRADVEQKEPALHVEFVEVLQDMIGDLHQRTSAG